MENREFIQERIRVHRRRVFIWWSVWCVLSILGGIKVAGLAGAVGAAVGFGAAIILYLLLVGPHPLDKRYD